MADDLAQQLKSKLREFWDANMATAGGEPSPFPVDSGMDSVTAVHVLCELETIVGVNKIPVSVIRPGGYSDEADFVNALSKEVLDHLSPTASTP